MELPFRVSPARHNQGEPMNAMNYAVAALFVTLGTCLMATPVSANCDNYGVSTSVGSNQTCNTQYCDQHTGAGAGAAAGGVNSGDAGASAGAGTSCTQTNGGGSSSAVSRSTGSNMDLFWA